MNSLTLLLLGAALYTPLSGLAAETEPAAATLVTTLEELGYPDGLTFDGSTQPSERTLLFHLPKEMGVKSATLRIVYRGSPQLGRGASLNAVINEQPPQMIEVMADKQTREWQIAVPASELSGGQLKVALSSNIPVDYDTIIDGEPQSGFVHVASETELTSSVEGVPRTLRDAWLTLPDDVTVTVPRGAMNEAAFRTTLDWVALLQRHRHTVRITTLPELGDLVIAPESDIAAALAYLTRQPAESRTLWSRKGNNIGLVGFKGKVFIAVTQPYAAAAKFASSWQELPQSAYVEITPLTVEGGGVEIIPLDVRGLSTAPALLGHKLQWRATLTPWNLPPGTRPSSATLHLMVPHTEPQEVFRLFIYLNDKMVMSERFSGDGGNKKIVVPFDAVPRADSYRLRLVVRDSGAHDGSRPTSLYPFTITPQSHATLEGASQTPAGFSSVPSALGHGFDLYVPREYLETAPRYLAGMGQLLAGFVVPSTEYSIVMLEPGQMPAPHRSFIIAGDAPPAGAAMPVRFDEGKVQLINSRGERLIGEQRLRSASVVQLVDSDDVRGLWFHPGEHEKLPVIDANILGSDDVAVYEPDQLALSMNSNHKDLVRPQYLESPRWYERLYNQRVMWLQFGWVLLTIGVVYLYLKSRQHRNG